LGVCGLEVVGIEMTHGFFYLCVHSTSAS
jgi:hypothetical protein